MAQEEVLPKEGVLDYIQAHRFTTLKELHAHFKKRNPNIYLKDVVDALQKLTKEDCIETRVDPNNHMNSVIASKGFMPDPDP